MATRPSQTKFDIATEAKSEYLKKIKEFYSDKKNSEYKKIKFLSESPYKQLIDVLKDIRNQADPSQMSKLYSKFQIAAENVAKHELNDPILRSQGRLDDLFIKIYENDNKIDEKIYKNVIEPGGLKKKHTELNKNLETLTTNPSKRLNIFHPDNPLNAFFSSMLGINYNPLKNNNVPYVAFNKEALPSKDRICLRIGAQTQGAGIVNPTFERYLLANARRKKEPKQDLQEKVASNINYEYVYINLLKRPQDQQGAPKEAKNWISMLIDRFVRFSEGKRAQALENLNKKSDLKAAVITLPAEGDFFLGKFSMGKGQTSSDKESLQTIYEGLKESIIQNKNDFYIPLDIKKSLFFADKSDSTNESKTLENLREGRSEVLEELFKEAVKESFSEKSSLNDMATPAQRNAILFHFVKFTLSNHILEKLNPQAYNMSCKDAIDRGGIHTLWYHMNLRYQDNKPMKQEEFQRLLDSPAMIVKYRPLNNNLNLLWNALAHRMSADPNFAKAHEWAKEWLETNKPQQFNVPEPTPAKPLPESSLVVKSGLSAPALQSQTPAPSVAWSNQPRELERVPSEKNLEQSPSRASSTRASARASTRAPTSTPAPASIPASAPLSRTASLEYFKAVIEQLESLSKKAPEQSPVNPSSKEASKEVRKADLTTSYDRSLEANKRRASEPPAIEPKTSRDGKKKP